MLTLLLAPLLVIAGVKRRSRPSGVPKASGETLVFPLEHSTNGRDYSPRGELRVAFTRPSGVVRITNEALEGQQKFGAEFAELVRTEGFYHVRVRQEVGNEASTPVVAVARACALVNSDFEDVFTLHLDEKKAQVLGLDYAAADEYNACGEATAAAESVASKVVFRSSGGVSFAERIAPLPLRNANMQPPPGAAKKAAAGDKGGKEGGAAPQGFLRKYWYIILPVFVMMMLNPGAPDDGGGKGGGGGGGGGK